MNDLSVNAINVSAPAITNNKAGTVNFRATQQVSQNTELDTFKKEYEKQKKKAEKEKNLQLGLQIFTAGLFTVMVGILAKQTNWFKSYKAVFKDLSNEMGLKDMALPDSQKAAAERIRNFIEHHKEILEMGGPNGSSILFYGPPGTGKNTFAYAITKEFPKAKFLEMDISKMNSKWHGESEQNVLGTMKAAIKYADKHKDEKVFVFIDEIDSVMMQDHGSGAKLSNDILNAFKKGFNELTNKENIIVMGATNLKINPEEAMAAGKQLDSAMLDRFAEKVLVDLPTKDQIKLAITNYYKNPARPRVDAALKDFDNTQLDKIAEFLSKPEHETSFRKLVKGILEPTASQKEVTPDAKVSIEDIIETIKRNKHNLNVSDTEMQTFINSVK